MQSTENEIVEKNAKQCGDCFRDTLIPYEFAWTCFLCGCNVIKKELTNKQRKKNFNRIK